jgi:serine/threonine protein kinase
VAERFGNYVVHERLGSGGMATVHRATLTGIGGFERDVALKRLLPHLAHDESFVRAFVREARIAAQLRHVNVAQTYDLGLVGEFYYIAMELIEGTDVRNVLKHAAGAAGPMPPSLVLNLLCQVCDALDYAHRLTDEVGQPLGIVHRDVSPANIIVNRDGIAKLIDFGIAKASSSSLMTMSGQLKGKFAYIAPETMGGTFDARADLFSLGVVAHELLTAQPLLTGVDEIDTLRRVRELEIPAPSTLAPGIPEDIDTIVMTALARNPDERWQSAAAMRGALGVVASRPNLRATPMDLLRWIQWALEVRPSARRAAVQPRESVRRRAAVAYDTDVDSIDATTDLPPDTSDSDSIEVSLVVERPSEPITGEDRPALSPAALAADEDAAELGAAPASSATLEFLVGSTAQNLPQINPNNVRLERTTAGMRTPNLTRRTPSRPGSAQQPTTPPPTDLAATVDMSIDPRDDLEQRTTGRLEVLDDHGDVRTTANVPVFDENPDPRTLVSPNSSVPVFDENPDPRTLVDIPEVPIPDDHILAEVHAGAQSMPTLMIQAGIRAAPDAVLPHRPSRSSAPPMGPSVTARGAAVPPPSSSPPSYGSPYDTNSPYRSAPPMGHAPPMGSAPPPGHATPILTPGFLPPAVTPPPHRPGSELPTMVAAGTPRGVNAAPPHQPEPYVALGAEYSEAAASYAANVMTPPPGALMRPDPAKIAEEAIRDDQERRRTARKQAAEAADAAARAADATAAPRATKRSNTGATILLFVLTALIAGGAWAAYYFT